LSGRTQRVLVNGESSQWHPVLTGIPQGSVLGPILLVAFINLLPEATEGSEIFLFADDTKAFKEIITEPDCDSLQKDIDSMYEWTESSLLKFHPDKCATMSIGKSNVPRKVYTMGQDKKPLKESYMEKDIGVFIDDKELSFDEHISSKVNKANATMGVIRRNFEY
jgi:hypothetical protein